MPNVPPPYPDSAYAPSGELWWRLAKEPGSNRAFGDERKIAAWLAFNLSEEDTFTMRDLRRELGSRLRPNAAEHLNRRLRSLRPDGWIVYSYRDDASLPTDTYRLKKIGWHPGCGSARRAKDRVPGDMRRRVIERDGRRCVVCFVGGGEPYPGEPGTVAQLTAGHRVPGQRALRSATFDELQTECQRCNETGSRRAARPAHAPRTASAGEAAEVRRQGHAAQVACRGAPVAVAP